LLLINTSCWIVTVDRLSCLCWVRICGTLLRSQNGFLAVRKKLIASLGRPRHLANRYGLSGTIKVRGRHISAGWLCHWRRLARWRHGDCFQRRPPGKSQLAEEGMAAKVISPQTLKELATLSGAAHLPKLTENEGIGFVVGEPHTTLKQLTFTPPGYAS
jgi:hypothetical protein